MYKWIAISSPADFQKLSAAIGPEYRPETVAAKLAGGLTSMVAAILVEEKYTDKDYRSTYYNFYTKKGKRYSPDCVRLHFFGANAQFNTGTLELSSTSSKLEEAYFGFMVLRPTGLATIGRSVLWPPIRQGAVGLMVKAVYRVHLLGKTFQVEGFPSMDQHSDISVCAHAACWSILRHYSEKWRSTREFLTYEITLMAQEFNPGGLVPARGLNIWQAERVFQAAGLFPLVVVRPSSGSTEPFYRQMISYLDSGFPIFAAMRGDKHAVAVVGYKIRATPIGPVTVRRNLWDEVESLTVVDDNKLPYIPIPRPAAGSAVPYSTDAIDGFIVALPDKIFYPAEAILALQVTLQDKFKLLLAFPPDKETIYRCFLTTGNRLREHVAAQMSELPVEARKAIFQLPLPKFIWVVEYSSLTQWNNNYISVRAVLDATAGGKERDALWMVLGRSALLVFDRTQPGTAGKGQVDTPKMGSVPLLKMENLKLI